MLDYHTLGAVPRVQARGRLRRNTRPDGVNFALEGSGGEKTSPDICSFCKKSLLVLAELILKTKWKYLSQTGMKFSDNLAKLKGVLITLGYNAAFLNVRKTLFFQMSLVIVTLGVAKIVNISIAVDICRLKTAQKLSYMWADTSLSAFSIISVSIKDHWGHSYKN